MEEKILYDLDFTKGEVKVYIALLKLGNSTTGPIINKSKISKSKVYEILDRLIKKGVVSEIKDEKIKKFQAVNPEKLNDIFQDKKTELENVGKELEKSIPILKGFFDSIAEKQEVTVYKGYTGLKNIFEDVLNFLEEGDEHIAFVASNMPKAFFNYIKQWQKRRIKKKIHMKVIYNNKISSQVSIGKKSKFSQIKILKQDFTPPAVFNLYKNKTAILLWSKNPIGILIENEEITNSFRQYFEMMWKIAK